MSFENLNFKNMLIGATVVSLVVAVSLKLLEDVLGLSADMRVVITSTLGTLAAVYFGNRKTDDS
jgi:hypothetical protein